MAQAVEDRIVLGTAGHIDHGKTSLVRALTGIETDRLKEERERGITIELGFATMALPDGRTMSIVDVPGHERFVRNMVAGAAGIDTVLFVVAADEGVMPQTREHLEICSLLGVESGLIALTKTDIADEEFIELVREDVAELAEGTFLEGAPMIPVSATTGEGVEDLREALFKLASTIKARDAKGLFRLPVDRVFTIKGFGTVVTGTAASGALKKEDEVVALPGDTRAKVRGIEVHGEQVDKCYAGNRVALNFSGVSVEDFNRGDVIALPNAFETTRMIDVHLSSLVKPGASSSPRPLEDRASMRLHIGTREVPVVVALLDRSELAPGDKCFAQLRSREKFLACPGDRFVLRAFSPAHTVGGGVVLDPSPVRHKGNKPQVAETLETLRTGEPAERLEAYLTLRAGRGLLPAEAQVMLGTTLEQARNLLGGAVKRELAVVTDAKTKRHIDKSYLEKLEGIALGVLEKFHADNPLQKGLGLEELRTRFPRHIDPRLVDFALERMAQNGLVSIEGKLIRASSFTVTLSTEDTALRTKVTEAIAARGYEAPTLDEAAALVGEDAKALKPVLDYLVEDERLVRTKEGLYFDSGGIGALTERVIALLAEQGQITVPEVKEFAKVSRKYLIPLVELLDNRQITRRNGDVRVAGPKGRS
jgi:selenocysteine-specific elongation factor